MKNIFLKMRQDTPILVTEKEAEAASAAMLAGGAVILDRIGVTLDGKQIAAIMPAEERRFYKHPETGKYYPVEEQLGCEMNNGVPVQVVKYIAVAHDISKVVDLGYEAEMLSLDAVVSEDEMAEDIYAEDLRIIKLIDKPDAANNDL